MLTETTEEEIFKKEFDRRRTRLGVSGPEELKKEIGREVWGPSKVSIENLVHFYLIQLH